MVESANALFQPRILCLTLRSPSGGRAGAAHGLAGRPAKKYLQIQTHRERKKVPLPTILVGQCTKRATSHLSGVTSPGK